MKSSPSPLAVFAAFALGSEAVVGLSLGLAQGLSELLKTVLVVFIAAWPILSMLALLPVASRSARARDELDFDMQAQAFTFRSPERSAA